LMCSPSRTQFLTGRYAMNLGFGEFIPWDDAEIGGIPIGQPTIANWLSQFGDYTTYGVGKWQLGYANRQLTPEAKGFNHFYGFYQGAINYVTKTYNDIVYGDIGVYDFWEDEKADYSIIDSPENTMDLYSNKIQEYLSIEGDKLKTAISNKENPTPFYLLAALQSPHVPLPVVPEHEDECKQRVISASGTLMYKNQRQLYCQMTLLADKVIGEIMDSLKSNGLYDNTLIVFTSDNGGETDRGGSNYPFRGTKGELYEGNTRVITSIAGGIIEKQGLFGQVREEMVSNLDWTPTLLSFAGLLGCIAPEDRTWDGMDQYDMIMDTAAYSRETDARQSLVVNVGDRELRSARTIVEHEGTMYKCVNTDSSSSTDRWIYSGRLSDVWSVPDYSRLTKLSYEKGKGLPSLKVIEYEESNEELAYSQVYDDAFLFDLTNDEAEMYNLLHPQLPHHDAELNKAVIAKCNEILDQFVQQNQDEFFSEPLDFLHERLDVGDPSMMEDGKFVRPFLTNKRYKTLVVAMIEREGDNVPSKLAELYTTPWTVPAKTVWELKLEGPHIETAEDEGEEEEEEADKEEEEEEGKEEEEDKEEGEREEHTASRGSRESRERDTSSDVVEGAVIVEEEGLNVVMDDDGVIVVESVEEITEGELEEDELAEEIEIDTLDAPKELRLEVMLPIILAAAIILLAIAVLLLYHFVYKKRKPQPPFKLIDATDLMVDQDSVSSYETF